MKSELLRIFNNQMSFKMKYTTAADPMPELPDFKDACLAYIGDDILSSYMGIIS